MFADETAFYTMKSTVWKTRVFKMISIAYKPGNGVSIKCGMRKIKCGMEDAK